MSIRHALSLRHPSQIGRNSNRGMRYDEMHSVGGQVTSSSLYIYIYIYIYAETLRQDVAQINFQRV